MREEEKEEGKRNREWGIGKGQEEKVKGGGKWEGVKKNKKI